VRSPSLKPVIITTVKDPDEMTAAIPEEFLRDGHVDLGVLGLVSWLTDVGHVRQRNEDRLLVRLMWEGSHLLLLVADGAGGHERGDKAAEQVVLTFEKALSTDGRPPAGEEPAWLSTVICEAHLRVRSLAEGESRPPASTVVGLLIETASLCAWRFHVGDSRVYSRELGGMVAQLTRDHNIANGLIDRGLAVSQAMKVAEGARLTQVLGGGVEQEPEVHGPLQLQSGQCVLLASDGAFGHNGEREVLLPAMKTGELSILERSAELKAAVLEGEAPDNLTAVLWEVPGGLVATVQRDTVTNSMKALTDADVTRRVAITGPETYDDDDDDDDEGPVLWSSATLLALLLVVAVGLSVMRLIDAADAVPAPGPEPPPVGSPSSP
jgi:serine/threonine protein phosphatase PrpC